MTDESDFVREYIRLTLALQEAKRRARLDTLKKFGYTEDGYEGLKARMIAQSAGAERIETELGTLHRETKPVYLHQNARQIAVSERYFVSQPREKKA